MTIAEYRKKMKLKYKVTHAEYTHRKGGTAHDSKLIDLHMNPAYEGENARIKRFRFRYRAFNAGEEFTGELFDGVSFKPTFTMSDLGVQPDSSAYHILEEGELKTRIEMLFNKGIEYIEKLFN
jgi:hypothetical protein